MSMRDRNIVLQTLILGGRFIPPSGDDGESARIVHGPRTQVQRGTNSSIVSGVGQPDDILTVQTYHEDPAYAILRDLYARQESTRAAGARVPLPGSFVDAEKGLVVSWANSIITQHADTVYGRSPSIVTWTISLAPTQVQ